MNRKCVVLACLLLSCTASRLLASPAKYQWWETDDLGTYSGLQPRHFWNDRLWSTHYKTVEAFDANLTPTPGGKLPDGYYLTNSYATGAGMFLHARNVNDRYRGYLYWSPDGYQDFTEVLDLGFVQYQSLHRSMVDVGNDTLIYFDYAPWPSVRVSRDAGRSWSTLIGRTRAVRHYHGAVYDPQYETLYVMSGDGGVQPSILFTDNIFGSGGLLDSPELWQQRWGLLDDDPQRTTLDPDWVLSVEGEPTGQTTRSVDMILRGDYIYWAMDAPSGPVRVLRADRLTHETEYVGGAPVVGAGWRWVDMPGGPLVLLTDSELNKETGQYYPGTDEYTHMYAVSTDGPDAEVTELARFLRTDADAPQKSAVWPGGVEAWGKLWVYNDRDIGPRNGLTLLSGDFNLDGVVDDGDLNVILSSLGTTGAAWSNGDADQDGNIDWDDLVRLLDNFGAATPSAVAIQAVPEPSGFVLLVLGLLLFFTATRRTSPGRFAVSCPCGRGLTSFSHCPVRFM